MARPVVGGLTGRLFDRLPELYRSADEESVVTAVLYGEGIYGEGPYGGSAGTVGYPLLSYLSTILDQASEVEAVIDRMDYVSPAEGGIVGDTSELVDPYLADLAWLPWLAQLVGARIENLAPAAAREVIATASSGWRAGTKAGMADAARSALTGSRYVRITDHAGAGAASWGTQEAAFPTWADIEAAGSWASLGAGGAMDPWAVQVLTRPSETPVAAEVLQAIIDAGAKPAGVILVYRSFEASWSAIEAAYPTWADIEAAGSWLVLEDTGS